jgi:hypothetical protein
MAVTASWFGKALEGQYSATSARRVDWATDTIKIALCTSSYTPNQDTHDFFDDVTNEVSGTGYSAGGVTLGSKTLNYDSGTNVLSLRGGTSSWSSATFTTRYAVIYKDTGTAGTSPLLGWVDFGGDQSVSSGTFSISWDATDGLLKITAS